MRLQGKIAIITGAASGIGAATAELFVREGAKIVVADRNYDQAKETAEKYGESAIALEVDVSDSKKVKAMVEDAVKHFGGIDILINNAGYGCLGSVVDVEEDQWDDVINVNLKGVFLCSKYAIPHMVKRGKGAIVNTASTIAVVGIKDRAAYVAAKGGVAALTRAMALDHIADGIRVNSVAPGVIASKYFDEMYKKVADPVAFKKWNEGRAPIGRLGQPSEIAAMMLWLASEESSFATGAMFTVDGGYTAW